MEKLVRGVDRERELARDEYYSQHYFSMPQLCSFAHQLNHIYSMMPSSVIEIGLGNGFVSTFLRRAGVPVTTADINPSLEPDICAPLSDVRQHIDNTFDLVICCEVLEHMPLEELDKNLDHLRSLGPRLFMTLPNVYRTWGMSGLTFLPKLGGKLFDFTFSIPWKHSLADGPHFWEVGHSPKCSKSEIVRRLRARYKNVRSGRLALNPYHIWFICD